MHKIMDSEFRGRGNEVDSHPKIMSREGNPEFATVMKVLDAVGLKLNAVPG